MAAFTFRVDPTALSAEVPSSVGALFSTDIKTENGLVTYANGLYPVASARIAHALLNRCSSCCQNGRPPSVQERTYNTSATLQSNTYPLVGRALLPGQSGGQSLGLITQRPMETAAFNNSIEFSLHRSTVAFVSTTLSSKQTVLRDLQLSIETIYSSKKFPNQFQSIYTKIGFVILLSRV